MKTAFPGVCGGASRHSAARALALYLFAVLERQRRRETCGRVPFSGVICSGALRNCLPSSPSSNSAIFLGAAGSGGEWPGTENFIWRGCGRSHRLRRRGGDDAAAPPALYAAGERRRERRGEACGGLCHLAALGDLVRAILYNTFLCLRRIATLASLRWRAHYRLPCSSWAGDGMGGGSGSGCSSVTSSLCSISVNGQGTRYAGCGCGSLGFVPRAYLTPGGSFLLYTTAFCLPLLQRTTISILSRYCVRLACEETPGAVLRIFLLLCARSPSSLPGLSVLPVPSRLALGRRRTARLRKEHLLAGIQGFLPRPAQSSTGRLWHRRTMNSPVLYQRLQPPCAYVVRLGAGCGMTASTGSEILPWRSTGRRFSAVVAR